MDKNTRICIIGGGPAGLSAGMYLEKKGYENYTIFERLDRVGGKCWSPYYKGRRYEMGAIMGVPSYYAVHDVEEFCGITHDGPKLNRNYKDANGKVIEPFARTLGNIIKNPWMLQMKGQLKKFGEILETKYKGYDLNGHRGVAEGRYDGYAVTPGREKVERKDGKVYVTVNGKVEEYDKIIVTAPLYIPNKRADGQKGMVDYFDTRDDEMKLFSKIDYERYDVQAFLTKPENHPEISYYVFDNMVPEKLGHLMVYYRRWRDEIDQVITTYALRKHKNSAEIPYDTCRQMVQDDLKVMGNPAEEVINEWSVYYFPHVFTSDYADGWYDKVEAMQGKYDTFYAGEVMSFGDMDETAEYSRELVERFF